MMIEKFSPPSCFRWKTYFLACWSQLALRGVSARYLLGTRWSFRMKRPTKGFTSQSVQGRPIPPREVGSVAPLFKRLPWNEVGLTRVEGHPMADDQQP